MSAPAQDLERDDVPEVTAQRRRFRMERAARRVFASTPPLTVSQWADTYRRIAPEHNPEEPGPWRTARAPYLREIMDALSDPDVERVVFRKSSRVGGSEVGNNFLAWAIDQRPRNTLVMLPSIEEAEGWSKETLDPLTRDTARLRGRVKEPGARREKSSTIKYKAFPGGYIAIVGSNAAAGLRRRSVAYFYGTEIDGYAKEARGGRGKEGDSLNLGIKRTRNVRSRKIYLESTPTEKPSRICREYDLSDQREYWVPCYHCGHLQTLKWANIEWEAGDPRTTVYRCGDYKRHPDGSKERLAGCGGSLEEHHKAWMLAEENGATWIPKHPERRTRGYFLWSGYSPFTTWAQLVDEWLSAQGDRTQLKAFVNTVLGEEWEEVEAELDQHVLAARRTRWPAPVPGFVGLLTCGVDVQGDRLEGSVWGFGAGEQAAVVRHEILTGSPGQGDVWNRLDMFLAQGWQHESGATIPIRGTCIDIGGHHTDEVYAFIQARPGRNIWAVKGSSTPGAQAIGPPKTVDGWPGVSLIVIGTDTIKDSLTARLDVDVVGPKYVHFPWDLSDDYFEQLTSEVSRARYVNRRMVRRYELLRGRRNETWDCAVYALAALYILGPYRQKLGELAENLVKGEQPPWPGARGKAGAGRRRGRVRFKGVDQ